LHLVGGGASPNRFNAFRDLPGAVSLNHLWSASEQMFVVLNAGDTIALNCAVTTDIPEPAGNVQVDGVLSGYFVPAF